MWLHAIALDEVRDMIGATDAEAARLRAIAAERFGRPRESSTGLLGKLGPVLRRPIDAPVLRPDTPLAEDCDRLLAGKHVPPPRLAASWRLLQAWIAATAWSTHGGAVDRAALNTLDFDLARAGVAARFGVSALVEHQLSLLGRQAMGPAGGGGDEQREAFGEHLALTSGIATKELADVGAQAHRQVGPGQVGDGTIVVAVRSTRRLAARGAERL